ncbi:MAG: response regulator [Gemmatimonadota bacterium]
MAASATVLVVEDNPDNRAIYALILRHSGYHVLEAADGETALEIVSVDKPDLVLLDLSLPRLDGFAVAAQLKSDVATRHIPLIALTAHAFEEDRQRAEAVGFDRYLAKPIEPRHVLREVARYLKPDD